MCWGAMDANSLAGQSKVSDGVDNPVVQDQKVLSVTLN